MPLLPRVIVRTALAWLLAALATSGLMALQGQLPEPWSRLYLQPLFYHLLMVGWVTQLIWGVALWLFPPLSREQPRGDDRLIWLAYALFNSGLGLRLLSEPAQGLFWGSGPMLVAAAILQTVSVWLIIASLWPRVRAKAFRPAPKAGGKP
jgi:hypothetical protein